jgi:hypothetical protein
MLLRRDDVALLVPALIHPQVEARQKKRPTKKGTAQVPFFIPISN